MGYPPASERRLMPRLLIRKGVAAGRDHALGGECVVGRHPSADFVLEATYVGVPDEKWGERPVAILTLVPGATENEDDVMRYLETEGVEKGRITRWMLPDYVLITDQIPKTSVGKFDKIAIRKNLGELLPKAKQTRRD